MNEAESKSTDGAVVSVLLHRMHDSDLNLQHVVTYLLRMTYCRELGRKTFLKKLFLDVPRKKLFLRKKKILFLFFDTYYYYFSP